MFQQNSALRAEQLKVKSKQAHKMYLKRSSGVEA